jgi:hypothetical protein
VRAVRFDRMVTLLPSTQIRAQRGILSLFPNPLAAGEKRRSIFDRRTG